MHDAPGFHTNEQRKCRLHRHDPPHKSRHFNNCGKFKDQMKKWLATHVINKIDDIIHPEHGALSQNASERVGDVALLYRDKETPLLATHYTIATNLAVAHVNSVVFDKMWMALEQEGDEPDARLEAFGTFERRLHQLLGLSYSPEQEKAWAAAVRKRSKRSYFRQTVQYKRKRKDQRKALRERREKSKASSASYKGDGGGGKKRAAGSGDAGAGACGCTTKCATKRCECMAAGKHCSRACHQSNKKCENCHAGGGGLLLLQAPGAGSSSATAGSSRSGAAAGRSHGAADGAGANKQTLMETDAAGFFINALDPADLDVDELKGALAG